jgi:hypothetical protein
MRLSTLCGLHRDTEQYSKNFIYIFTSIDRTSKWLEAIPLSETSTAACAKALTFYFVSCYDDDTLPFLPRFLHILWEKPV